MRMGEVSAQTQLIANMQDTTWTRHDGAPLGIGTMTIGPDGLLYVATFSSIFRFDGATFEPVLVPGFEFTSSIRNLFFTQQGDLIISFQHGAPVLLHHGRGRLLDQSDGPAIESLYSPQQTAAGQLWALLNERRLVTLGDDGVWHAAPDPGVGRAHISRLFADAQDNLWIVVDDHLFRRSSAGTFERTSILVYGKGTIAPGLHSDLWISSFARSTLANPARHLLHLDGRGNLLQTRDVREPLLAASAAGDGSLWLLTEQSLLAHLPPGSLDGGGRALVLNQWRDRLYTRIAVRGDVNRNSFLLARDGSIWISGLSGIERFHKSILVPLLPNATPGDWGFCLERSSALWILDPRATLYLRTPDGKMNTKGTSVSPVFCSAFGNLAENSAGLSVLTGGSVIPLPTLPGLPGFGEHYFITGATRTHDGSILAVAEGSAVPTSIWRYQTGVWQKLDVGQLKSQVTGLYATGQDNVYFGFRDGTAGLLQPGSTHVRLIGQSGLNGIIGFSPSKRGLFAYGVSGLAVLRQGSFTAFSFDDPQVAKMVTGLDESSDGALWLNGGKGIVRVTDSEVSAALHDPTHRVLSTILSQGNYNDPAMPRTFGQSVQTDAKGRIWFNTLSGIVSVAPEDFEVSEATPVVLKSVLADGVAIPSNRTLSAGINSLNIRYVGVDFTSPSSLSYSYRLKGYDNTWQDVGARTEAVYTHLHAGRYTFQVRARNSFGVWTAPVTLDPFVIQPHLYEEQWFAAAIAISCAVLTWLAVQLRLRVAASNLSRRADERADERISIARDLHDTLLQGVQGLLMTFHAAIEGVPANHASRPALEHALTSAEKLIIEGRDRVKGLRGVHVSGDELGQLLQTVAEDLACSEQFHLSASSGSAKTILRDHVAAEIFLVGREVLVNAVRHADASRIAMRLRFDPEAFSLECEDNGVGFDPLPYRSRTHQPRWGIPGIRERVEALRGSLSIRSAPGEGTLVRVLIKARFAYQ